MFTGQNTRQILSIGCSCINRFQFDFFVRDNPERASSFPRGLFDWNITSLEATIHVLELAAAGELGNILNDSTAYSVAYDTLIFNTHLPGFSFFHEKAPAELLADADRRKAFFGKLNHLSEPFSAPQTDLPTHLIWSNIQPNLPDTVENVIPWDDFVLTQDRYQKVRTLGQRIFGSNTSFSFLSTRMDMEPDLAKHNDVHVIDLARGKDYQGAPDLYATLLSDILQPSH